MPLLNKQPFIPRAPPQGLARDALVYHCQPTGEIFEKHEDYFSRMILLNTTSWSCSLTRKSNLTYFEAVAAEQEAERELVDFPESLEIAILFIVHRLTNRGRFEDLVNDVYHILRDRFFNNEQVAYAEKSKRLMARVVISRAIEMGIVDENGMEMEEGAQIKEPVVQPPENFLYTMEMLEGVEMGEDRFRENVKCDKLFRSKTYGSRQKIRLFLKTSCHLLHDGDRYTVREELLPKIQNVWWSDIMSGVEPVCPQTPVQQRGRIPNMMKTVIEGGEVVVMKERKPKREDRDPSAPARPRGRPPKTPEQRAIAEKEKKEKKKEKRKRSQAPPPPPLQDYSNQPDDFDLTSSGALTLSMVLPSTSESTATTSEPPAKKKIRRSSVTSGAKNEKNEKKKAAKIQEQQGELDFYFTEARRLGIDVSGLEQNEKFLSPKKVSEFKQKVKEEKDTEREQLKEEKKRKLRERAAYNKKREDLICNDLKPLPRFPKLEIPNWMTDEEFGDYLFILQFFTSFKEILPLKEIRGNEEVQFSDIVIAMKCFDPQNSPFADLMKVLLTIRTDIADDEDGDEADIQNNRDEIMLINVQNCDPVNVQWGESIREISETHYRIRKMHGKSVRHLPVDWMTLTEVLRLIFLTSGYYTGISTHRHRLYARGNFRGYEDPCFELRTARPDIMEKLRTQTVFDLEPTERLEIMKALIYQLLTYAKFRSHMDKQQMELLEMKREQRRLKAWDTVQEGEATSARLLLELGNTTGTLTSPEKKKEMAGVAKKFKGFIKAINEGRRYDKEEFDAILLSTVPYTHLTMDEIVTARDLQKAEFKSLMSSITTRLFSTYCTISDIRLGSDRAYRRYLVMDQLSAILVETPTSSELRIECDEPSQIDDVENLEDSDEKEVFVCTGDQKTCRIHGEIQKTSSRWHYIRSRAQLEHLMASLNPRGNREVELLEGLQEYREELGRILERTEELQTPEDSKWSTLLMTGEEDPADTYNIDWDTEIRELLLDYEEKLEQAKMGSVEKTFGVERVIWREHLKREGDVMEMLTEQFLKLEDVQEDSEDPEGPKDPEMKVEEDSEDPKYPEVKVEPDSEGDSEAPKYPEVKVEVEEDSEAQTTPKKTKKPVKMIQVYAGTTVSLEEELSDAKKLAIAFWMIVRSIQMKFIKPPHLSSQRDEYGNQKPSEMFIRWQKGLLECDSHSSLTLFISTFEGSIKWDKSRLQGKCRGCRRKIGTLDLIQCSECDNCYHLKCAKLGQSDPLDWKCTACKAQQRKLENEAKRAARAAETFEDQESPPDSQDITLTNMSIQDSDEHETTSSEPSTSSRLVQNPPSQNPEVIRTLSGRAVKKVQYQEVHEGTAGLKSSRKSNGFGGGTTTTERPHRNVVQRIYDDSENDIHDEDYSDGENSSRRRKTPSTSKKSLPSSSTSAITTTSFSTTSFDSQKTSNREKMSAIEALLKETMRQECSWPFLQPVDKKEVPDYFDVIKRPMDLRTMVNKIKQRIYNKPSEIRTDFQLILTNCETYNETESEIFQLSRQLDDFVTARLDAILDR